MHCNANRTELTARVRSSETGEGVNASCNVKRMKTRPATFIPFHIMVQFVSVSQKLRSLMVMHVMNW